jgi:hypothetical protein
MGHIVFPRPVRHPLASSVELYEFPIVPIGFRCNDESEPNQLGRKYEHLVLITSELQSQLPPQDSPHYYERVAGLDTGGIEEALSEIEGRQRDSESLDTSTLLGLPCRAVVALDSNAVYLARSCGLVIRFDGRI